MNLSLLKNRNFFLLVQGKLVSMFGSFMMTFAMSLYVLKHYESTTMFASVLILGIIPSILLGPLAGVFVDRFDRRLTLIFLDIISGLSVLVTTAIFYIQGTLPLAVIYGITIILATINTIYGPAIASAIPLLFNKEQLFEANTIDRLVFMLANIGGPLTAGILMGITDFGVVMLINGISYLFSAVTEVFIKLPKLQISDEQLTIKTVMADLIDGFKFFGKKPVLIQFLVLLLIINFATGPLSTIAIPYYLKKVLVIPDAVYGVFNAVVVIAMILSMLASGAIRKRFTIEKIIRYDFGLLAILVGVFVLTTTNPYLALFDHYMIPMLIALILMCVAMMFDTIGGIAIDTALQHIVPKAKFGRIMTVFSTGVRLAVPVGQSLIGIGIDALPLWIPMAIVWLFTTLGSVLIIVFIKDDLLTKEAVEEIIEGSDQDPDNMSNMTANTEIA